MWGTKTIFRFILVVMLALLAGLGIAAYRVASIAHSPAFVQYGSWRGTRDLPLNRDDLVTTQVTLFALFALPSHEAIYLFASEGADGLKLNGKHDYTIKGNVHDIKAAYWSITAYGNDQYLIPNQQNRYSFNAANLKTDSAGNYQINISAVAKEGNWLPVKPGAGFRLVLRLYQGEADFIQHLNEATLPVINKSQ